MLSVRNLQAGYDERLVIKGVSFDLPEGCILALIGPNGSGKSTLIRCLSGVLPPVSGDILFKGKTILKASSAERARWMAVVPQARNLPPAFTGWEMVSLGRTPYLNWLGQLSEKDESLVQKALELTSTLDLAERRIGELSGGEQQRLLLARALAQAAPILLLDEPTTHLDLQHQLSMLERLRGLAHPVNGENGLPWRRLSALVVLHDLNLAARFADQVGLLVNGELRALGSPQDVLTEPLLSAVYQVPIEVMNLPGSGRPVILPRAH